MGVGGLGGWKGVPIRAVGAGWEIFSQKNKQGGGVYSGPKSKSLSIDSYAFAIKTKHSYFIGWKTVGHIPREICRYVYFFMKEENEKVFGTLKSLK